MTERERDAGRARARSSRRRRRGRGLRWLVFLAALSAAVFLWLRTGPVFSPPAPDRTAERADAVEEIPLEPVAPAAGERETPAPESAPGEVEPAEIEPLPTLAESDAVLRREAAALSDARAWRRWLVGRDLLERFVLAVVQVSEGASPRKPLAGLAPRAAYRVRTAADGRLVPDPASYARYDEIAQALAGLDAAACASLYDRFEPLVDEIYAQLGSPDTPLRGALGRGAAELLSAPRVIGEPELVSHVKSYRYADPALERLSGAQKLILRTGPANARRIQGKLREIALALGIPERDLPDTPVYRVGTR